MPLTDPGRPGADRVLGTAIGAAGALASGYGAVWSGHSQSVLWVAAVAFMVGGGLGALTWGLFQDDSDSPSWWFVATFGGGVGMVSGAFAGFPLGGVFGAGGGAVGALAAAAVWRASASPRTALGVTMRGALAAVFGTAAGFGAALWMAA
ncbi:MAG: hypothetical protein ACPGU1_16555 [Myxococcota bacterium]